MIPEFIKISPEGKAEFVIRTQYVLELNGPYENSPAICVNLTRSGKEAVSEISKEEYERLCSILMPKDS